jgi:mannose-1-phosphate guanylyltransferase
MADVPGNRTKALLLAGGIGSRLRPITDATPKCLVDIAGRPLLEYWFQALGKAGIRDVLINTHHLPEPVRLFLKQKNKQGFRSVETYEPQLLGSAGTITANPDWADDADDVVIIYADNLSDMDIAELMTFHRDHGDPMTMLLFHAPNPKACGIAELDDDGGVITFEEKPAEPKSDLANAGVYVVTAAAWREVVAMKAFDLGFDVLPCFVGRMRGHIHHGYHRDIGNIDALNAAREFASQPASNLFDQNIRQKKGVSQ